MSLPIKLSPNHIPHTGTKKSSEQVTGHDFALLFLMLDLAI